jgi:hypothetical protein
MRLILIVLFLLIAGAMSEAAEAVWPNGRAPSGVLMVHPASGKQLRCPLKPGDQLVGTWEQYTQLLKLIEDQKQHPLNELEFCIKQLEIYGYVRAPSN